MAEAFTTTEQMLDRVKKFLSVYERNKATFPESLQQPMSYLYTLEKTLEYGITQGFEPAEELVEQFGLAAILMDGMEKEFSQTMVN